MQMILRVGGDRIVRIGIGFFVVALTVRAVPSALRRAQSYYPPPPDYYPPPPRGYYPRRLPDTIRPPSRRL